MFGEYNGIKIGSTYSCSATLDKENIPTTKLIKSCVSVVKDETTGQFIKEIVGEETPDSVFPLDKGIIESDANIANVTKIINRLGAPTFAKVVAAIPAVEIMHGRNRLKQCLLTALQPDKLILYPEVYCGAVECLGYEEVDGVSRLKAPLVDLLAVNLGSTTTELLVSVHGRKKYMNAYTDVCGSQADSRIDDALQNALGKVLVTKPEVRRIKEQFNMVSPVEIPFRVMTKEGIKEVMISQPIQKVLTDYTCDVAKLIKSALVNNLDRETITQVLDSPIVTTGGMGNIPGLIELLQKNLQETLNYEVKIIKQPNGQIAPCLGALKLARAINWEKVP